MILVLLTTIVTGLLPLELLFEHTPYYKNLVTIRSFSWLCSWDEDLTIIQLLFHGYLTSKTILFKTIAAADEACKTLIAMIDVTLDCNAITYNNADEETVRWLIKDDYCYVGSRERIYPYLVEAIAPPA